MSPQVSLDGRHEPVSIVGMSKWLQGLFQPPLLKPLQLELSVFAVTHKQRSLDWAFGYRVLQRHATSHDFLTGLSPRAEWESQQEREVAERDGIREDKNTERQRHERRCWFVPLIEENFANSHVWDQDTVNQSRAICFLFGEVERTPAGLYFDMQQSSGGELEIGKSG